MEGAGRSRPMEGHQRGNTKAGLTSPAIRGLPRGQGLPPFSHGVRTVGRLIPANLSFMLGCLRRTSGKSFFIFLPIECRDHD